MYNKLFIYSHVDAHLHKYLKFDDCIKYISKFAKEQQIKYIRLNPKISKEKTQIQRDGKTCQHL